MHATIYVKLDPTIGKDSGPYDVYTDLDLVLPILMDVPRSYFTTLLGLKLEEIDDEASYIVLVSKSDCCANTTYIPIVDIATTTTTTLAPTTTTTTAAPGTTTTTTTLAPGPTTTSTTSTTTTDPAATTTTTTTSTTSTTTTAAPTTTTTTTTSTTTTTTTVLGICCTVQNTQGAPIGVQFYNTNNVLTCNYVDTGDTAILCIYTGTGPSVYPWTNTDCTGALASAVIQFPPTNCIDAGGCL